MRLNAQLRNGLRYVLSLDLSTSDGGHFQRIPSLTTAWSY